MLERLFDDTLWIYTAILGSLIGAGFLAYFKDTRVPKSYAKLDQFLDYLVDRWGLTWLNSQLMLGVRSILMSQKR